MEYMLLIYADPEQEESPELIERYRYFTESITERGAIRGGNQLYRSHSATTVRVRNSESITSDGPYAETKEQIGGYYIVECVDLDEAIEIAANIPNAEDGVIEVRPIMG